MKIAIKISGFVCTFFLLITTISCSNIQDIHVGNIREIDLKGINNNVLTLKVLVPIENPNSFNLKVKEADLKVMVGDKEIGKVKQIDNLLILRKTTQDYPVTLTVEITNLNDIMSSAFQMFTGRVQDARLTGTVVVKTMMYQKTIKIDNFPLVK